MKKDFSFKSSSASVQVRRNTQHFFVYNCYMASTGILTIVYGYFKWKCFAAQKIALQPHLPPRKIWFHSLTDLRKLTAACLAKKIYIYIYIFLGDNLKTEDIKLDYFRFINQIFWKSGHPVFARLFKDLALCCFVCFYL